MKVHAFYSLEIRISGISGISLLFEWNQYGFIRFSQITNGVKQYAE